MAPLGAHLAADPALPRGRRLLLRLLGAPEPGLRTRTREALRAALADGRPASAVEVGCGAGFAAIALALRVPGCAVTGVDANAVQIDRAATLAAACGAPNASFAAADALAWQPPAPVDVVLCLDALEYVADDALLLVRIREWLRPGGRLVLHCRAVPTPRLLPAFRAADPCFDGRSRSGYTREGLSALLTSAGLQPAALRVTMTPPAELAFELFDPGLGPLRSGPLRALAGPLLVGLAALGRVVPGPGAGLLAVAVRQ